MRVRAFVYGVGSLTLLPQNDSECLFVCQAASDMSEYRIALLDTIEKHEQIGPKPFVHVIRSSYYFLQRIPTAWIAVCLL